MDLPNNTEANAAAARFAYIPGLDGMRAVWVILGPLLYHARPDFIPGGILALDLFFVLSSYLITSIALNEWDRTQRIDLVGYAGRRARRLLPALLLCLGALTTYLVVWGDGDQYARWTGAIVSTLTYSANWYEIFSGVSYFEQYANPSPLVHVWSFAIEEQFYLFAPFFLLAGLRFGKRHALRVLAISSAVLAIASAVWMSVLYDGDNLSRVYYGTDTRAQALFVGIFLAVVMRAHGPVRTRTGRRLLIGGAYAASIFYGFAVFTISEKSAWMFERGGFLLMAVAAGVIVIGVTQPSRGPLHRFYEAAPIRYLGRISYGLYLYHLPIYLIVITPERLASSVWWVVAALALTLASAALSYALFEKPVMQRRFPVVTRRGAPVRLRPWPAAFASSVAVMLILVGLLAVNANKPPEQRQVLVAASVGDAPDDVVDAAGGDAGEGTSGASDGTTAAPGDGSAVPAPSLQPAETTRLLRVLVVGDSVSYQIGDALIQWSEQNPGRVSVLNHAHIGCIVARYGEKRPPAADGTPGPVGDVCSNWNVPVSVERIGDPQVVSWPTAVQAFRPDVVIANITPWDVTDRKVPSLGDDWTHIGKPDFDAYAGAEYREASQVLTARGAELIWLKGPALNRPFAPENDPARIARLNEIVGAATEDLPRVRLADFPAFIGPVGSDRETALRRDGVHLSDQGMAAVAEWITGDLLTADPARAG
jgi:peptidoglycan/LPS O-acetylase OafA/YrhL